MSIPRLLVGRMFGRCGVAALIGACGLATPALAQLRVCEWNVTNYGGAGPRDPSFKTAIYGVVPAPLALQGQSMSPDIFLGEEFQSAGAVANFKLILNTAPGSPGDWEAAPFIDGPDTDSAFFYRTSKVVFKGVTIVSLVTGSTSLPPRNTYRYDVRLIGYGDVPATNLSCYTAHMKAGSASTDQSRRLQEANKIRDNANGIDTNGAGTKLPAGNMFLFGADTNIQSSSQTAYQRLIQTEAIDAGRFFDPISTPGSWNNNSAFRFVHTQDPAVQMDDRHDQLLLCAGLLDGSGFDYIGNFGAVYSTTTWNDPNHSYRCWGNDGTSFDQILKIAGNDMVGDVIAQALVTSANGLGHLPVILDLRVPARVASDTVIDFGSVPLNSVAAQSLLVSNAGDTGIWGVNGISGLNYSLSTTAGFSAPNGVFADAAGGSVNSHTITMDTTTLGLHTGQITISSDAPDQPIRIVQLTGIVTSVHCPADFDGDGFVAGEDFDAFQAAFEAGSITADFDGDGFVAGEDFDAYVAAFESGC